MNDPVEVYGIVRGKTIELQEELGIPDGQHVTLTVRRFSSAICRKGS